MQLAQVFEGHVAKRLLLLFLVMHPVFPLGHERFSGYRNSTSNKHRPKRETRKCYTMLNEINIDNPRSRTAQFIEIIRSCDSTDETASAQDLSGYKLAIIRGFPVEIVFVADLSSKKFTKVTNFGFVFVVGGSAVPLTWKLNLNDPSVQNVNLDATLPLGDESPYGIVLMYAKEIKNIKDIALNKRNAAGNFIARQLNFNFDIFRYTVDTIVYGRKTQTNRCTIFEKILQKAGSNKGQQSGDHYMLRDWDNTSDEDMSINRCTSETTPFRPDRLRLGKPSPGSLNDCTGVSFFIEHHLPHLVLTPTGEQDVGVMNGCEPDTDAIPANKYRDLPEHRYHELVRHEMGREREKCASDNLRAIATAMDNVHLISTQQSIIAMGQTPRPNPFTLHTFDPSWVEQCKADFPFNGQLLRTATVQSWLDVVRRGGKCYYSCYYCKSYYALGFRADLHRKKQMCSLEGFHNSQPTRNKDEITGHMGSSVHQEAVNVITELAMASAEDQRQQILKDARDRETAELKATVDHFILTFASRKAGVSFAKHPVLVAASEMMGVNVGIHHYHATADQLKTATISAGMHSILLSFLIRENNEFSLIVDGSTDNTNVPYLICYIQSLEDGYPMVYFYRLVELADGESAEAIFSSFKEKVEEDELASPGFLNYFKTKLVAVTTDGANVMVGNQNSFFTRLRDFVGRHVASVWCMAHKLNLGIQKGLQTNQKVKNRDPDFWYFKYFEGIINKFYTFYMSWGSKTWQHLNAIAEELGLTVYRFRYFFSVRWSSSHYEAIRAIKRNFKALNLDLTAISLQESEFRQQSREKAGELHILITDQHFVYMVHEYLDFLYLFMQVSKSFQGSEGLLIAKAGVVEDLVDKLEQLKTAPGKFLQSFLDQSRSEKCGTAPLPACTVESYFLSDFVVYEEVSLQKNNRAYHFPNVRSKLYDSLIAGIKSYFNLPLLKSLQLFDPSTFQPDVSPLVLNQPPNAYCSVLTVRIEDWQLICEFFFGKVATNKRKVTDDEQQRNANTKQLYDECFGSYQQWKTLSSAIVSHDYLKLNFRETPAAFWFLALRQRDLPWTLTLQKIVRTVLVTPFGSSDCERGFSILNNVKNKARNRLTPPTVENILRVKINGPEDVTKFKAETYAREFLKTHVRPDDTTFGVRRKNPMEQKSFRKESRLF